MRNIGVGTFKVTPRMRELVSQVMDTGRISYGPLSRQFEHDLAGLHECRFGVLSNSGTSSLQVALAALKELYHWQDGDEVIVPAVTFVASVNVVLHNHLTPVLVDVDPSYYEISPGLIEDAITSRTRAIMPVHLFGQPCDMTRIMEIARRRNLAVIEDSCECMFVRHANQRVGSFGDVGCFSTYVAHLLTTGVGGMAVTNHPKLAELMRSMVNHGRDGIYISIDDDNGTSENRLKEIVSRRFRFERIGYSYRITELEAALGLGQLGDWRAIISARQANAGYLTRGLSQYLDRLHLPVTRPDTEHAWMMYPIVMRDEGKRGITEYLEAHGIETREMLPLTNQPCYAEIFDEDDYPVAKWINRSGFYVGCHQDLSTADLDYMIDAIGAYFDETVSRAVYLETRSGLVARQPVDADASNTSST